MMAMPPNRGAASRGGKPVARPAALFPAVKTGSRLTAGSPLSERPHAAPSTKRRIICFLFFLSIAAAAFAADAPKLKLDYDVRPTRYLADLKLSTGAADFTGSIDIELDLRKPANIVWLNAKEIAIRNATIKAKQEGSRAPWWRWTWPTEVETAPGDLVGFRPLAIKDRAPITLAAGRAQLHIEYSGKISPKDSSGIFQGRDADGNNYLFTQFESIDARRAFPCFDQPDFKTPWQLTLHIQPDDKAFSNTPESSQLADPDGFKRIVFMETKPLPSYLVAFAVGPFEVVDAGKAGRNHVPVRIITPKRQEDQAKYAAEVTATIVDHLEHYFGIPYPYEKVDNVAIPLTYGFGAMENAGLVTYEQTILLADPKTDTETRRRLYASVAAHELAHQWFGDLVTLAWWDDTWLNEAFATWTSSKILAEWKPEWHSRVDDLTGKFNAMTEDSLTSTRKIHQPIETVNDIENAFDDITYEKGSAVIRMFESWVGEKQFQSGVTSYLKRYAYKNARMPDFLDAISATGEPRLTSAFKTFLDQPGVPQISVKLNCQNAPSVTLAQKRYLPVGSEGSKDQTWQIPVCVRYKTTNGVAQECFLLTQPRQDFKLTKSSACPALLWANDHASGYYVDSYSDEMRSQLIAQSGFLDGAEQVTLVNDLARLANAGDLKESVALAAIPAFANSNTREVLEQAEGILNGARAFVPANLRPNYARFVHKSFGERADALGWSPKPGEDADTQLLRRSLVFFETDQGADQALETEARKLADQWLTDRKGVDPAMLNDVLRSAAHAGDRAFFDRLVAEFKKTKDLHQRQCIMNALGSFRDPALVDAAHKLLLDTEIDGRESRGLLYAGMGEPETQDMPFEFVKANYDALVKRLPSGGGSEAGAILPNVVAGCDAHAEEELGFFADRVKQFAGGPRIFDQVKERMKLCEARRSAMGADVEAFFGKQ
jgi:cytosol alanyl aminopeptidase